MQQPSGGAPQERRQQSAGQDVVDDEADMVGDCVGAVAEGVGVTQVQTILGKLPTQTYVLPTQGETDAEAETVADALGEAVAVLDAVTEPLTEGEADCAGVTVELTDADAAVDGDASTLRLEEMLAVTVCEVVLLEDAVSVGEGDAVPLGAGDEDTVTAGETETDAEVFGEVDAEALAEKLELALSEGLVLAETVGLSLSEVVGEMLADTEKESEGVAEMLGEGELLDDAAALGVGDGVPLHIQKPSVGAPQERRQQSAGQDVVDGEAVIVGDCVGAVAEGVGVTQVQTMLGKLPTQTNVLPTQGETDAETEALAVALEEELGDADSVTL